ncbi:PTS sugar transporter subunit IIB [uncultured Enorma sp.]|uniref:PTS sugar transporter subunit IIB n=1 Tax=uncultured Enorma sp. TaxID=1714346 RepID=UPI002803D023|nr:PTS sugar transporter subunit IIB [uncultured Enorma sp.]
MKRILVACGQGVATSTIVLNRFKEAMKERGVDGQYTTTQCKVGEVHSKADQYDFVVATAVISDPGIPFVNGVPILTGVGADKVWDQIAELIKQ